MGQYDAVFIGSGHNALVAAAYLARAGWGVLVLEKNDRPGGLVRTEELTLPGFRHDVYSTAHPLFVISRAYADLGPELAERGLRYLPTDLPTGVCMPGGRTAVFSTDMQANIAEAERLAPGDGTWTEDLKNRFADRVIKIVGLYVPDVPGAILGRYVISPLDLARFNPNLGDGDPYGGSHDLAQSYLFRPLPGQPSHRTAVPNLFMLGAATWPGHGVNAGSGYIVAQQLLHDTA